MNEVLKGTPLNSVSNPHVALGAAAQPQWLPPPAGTTVPPPARSEQEPPQQRPGDVEQLRADRARLQQANEELIKRLQAVSAELQKQIDAHPHAAHILQGTPGHEAPPPAANTAKSKFFKFVDEVTEKRDLREEVEVLRARLVTLTDSDADVRALQIGLELCQADYAASMRATEKAQQVAKCAVDEARVLRESLRAYEEDAADVKTNETAKAEEERALDEIFGEELAAKARNAAAATQSEKASDAGTAGGRHVGAIVAELRGRVAAVEAELVDERRNGDATRVRCDGLASNNTALQQALEAVENERDNYREREGLIMQANQKLEAQLKRLLGVVGDAQHSEAEAHESKETVRRLEGELQQLRTELLAERSCANDTASATLRLKKEIEELRSQLAAKEQQLSTLTISLEALEDQEHQLEAAKQRVNRLSTDCTVTRQEADHAKALLEKAEKQLRLKNAMLRDVGPRLAAEVARLQVAAAASDEWITQLMHERDLQRVRVSALERECGAQKEELVALRADAARHDEELQDTGRQAALDLRKANELNRELKRSVMSLEKELQELQARTRIPEPSSSASAAAGGAATLLHERTTSSVSDESASGSAASGGILPRVVSMGSRAIARISPRWSHSQFHHDGASLAEVHALQEKVRALEEHNAALALDNERKGALVTSIVAKHPEVMASPYAPTLSAQQALKAAHPLGFGKVKSCTPQEFHNLQQVLERTMVDNMRLAKDADVLAAEVGRLSDLLAAAAPSTKALPTK